jgi:hypothetical protein
MSEPKSTNDLDRKISEKLAEIKHEAYEPDMQAVLEAVRQKQRRVVRKLKWWYFGWHVFFLVALLIGVWMIFNSEKVNDIAIGLFVCTAALAGLIIIKVTYGVARGRMPLEMQLKQIELSIAELRESIKTGR